MSDSSPERDPFSVLRSAFYRRLAQWISVSLQTVSYHREKLCSWLGSCYALSIGLIVLCEIIQFIVIYPDVVSSGEGFFGDVIVVLWSHWMCLESVMRLWPYFLFPLKGSSHLQEAIEHNIPILILIFCEVYRWFIKISTTSFRRHTHLGVQKTMKQKDKKSLEKWKKVNFSCVDKIKLRPCECLGMG